MTVIRMTALTKMIMITVRPTDDDHDLYIYFHLQLQYVVMFRAALDFIQSCLWIHVCSYIMPFVLFYNLHFTAILPHCLFLVLTQCSIAICTSGYVNCISLALYLHSDAQQNDKFESNQIEFSD